MHKVIRFTLALAGIGAAALASATIPAGLTLAATGLSPSWSPPAHFHDTYNQTGSTSTDLGTSDFYVYGQYAGPMFLGNLEINTWYTWNVAYTGAVPPGTTVVTVEITAPTSWDEAFASCVCVGTPTPGCQATSMTQWNSAYAFVNIPASSSGVPITDDSGRVSASESTITATLSLNANGHFYGILKVQCRFDEMSMSATAPPGGTAICGTHGEEYVDLGGSATLLYSG